MLACFHNQSSKSNIIDFNRDYLSSLTGSSLLSAMSSPIGDYLFWKLATLGARQALGHGQSNNVPDKFGLTSSNFASGTIFIGSIQRNRLVHMDITRSRPILSSTEIGAFVTSSDSADLAACFELGRQYFPNRPVILVQELSNAELRR